MTEAIPPRRRSQVPDLEPLVRAVIGARVADRPTADDLTQETLQRLVVVEARLHPDALPPYAVVTARNMVRGLARRQERERRHSPRTADPRRPEDPEERAVQEEERRAVAAALARLPARDREPLIAHDVHGVETRALAQELRTTPRALAVRLSRARARLRVEYLLALRRVELPTSSCKRVLLALSAADKRQQRASGAGDHLLVCRPCAGLSDSLVRRRRPLAALWAFLGIDRLLRWLLRTGRQHPVPTATAAAGVVGVTVWAVMAFAGGQPSPTLFVQGRSPIPLSGDQRMDAYAGMTVEGRGVRVQSVVTPSAFWIGDSPRERVWVDVEDQPRSPAEIAPGRRISFEGRLTPNTPETLERAARGGPGDRGQLERQGYHVDVSGGTIRAG